MKLKTWQGLWLAMASGVVAVGSFVAAGGLDGVRVAIAWLIGLWLLGLSAYMADKWVTNMMIRAECLKALARLTDEKSRKETSHEGQEKHVDGDWRDYDADLGAGPADGL